MVGDGQGVAVVAVAELELALEVGAPQLVRRATGRQRRAACSMTRAAHAFDQAVPVQHRVDGAFGWDAHVRAARRVLF